MEQSPQTPSQIENKSLYSVREFSILYGISISEVKKRVRTGRLQSVKRPGSSHKTNKRTLIVDPGWETVEQAKPAHLGSYEVEDIYFLSGRHVANLLGITTRGVRKMCETGRMKYIKTGPDGHRRFTVAEVRRVLTMRSENNPTKRVMKQSRKKIDEVIMNWARKQLSLDNLSKEN